MSLRVTEGIEALEGVTNEGQAEVGVVGLASSFCCSTHLGGRVDLRNLIDGEVLRINGAGKLGLEWSTNLAKTIPVDAAEEGMLLELSSATHVAQTVLRVADQAIELLADDQTNHITCTYPLMKCSDSALSC